MLALEEFTASLTEIVTHAYAWLWRQGVLDVDLG